MRLTCLLTLGIFVMAETATSEMISLDSKRAEIAHCIAVAAKHYDLPPLLLLAIKVVESGNSLDAPINSNTNGTQDIGLMQINSHWLPKLKPAGITRSDLEDPCINISVAAWILNYEMSLINNNDFFWKAVGHYHSRNKELSARYVDKVSAVWERLQQNEREQ